MTEEQNRACGWYGTVNRFLAVEPSTLLMDLSEHHAATMQQAPAASQLAAWRNSIEVLRQSLKTLLETNSQVAEWLVVFEYELPRERGRRPDVVLLTCSSILVLEFKDYVTMQQAHIDQVAAYARDLRHYHAASHHHEVTPMLILTRAQGLADASDEVQIVSPENLAPVLEALAKDDSPTRLDPEAWLEADYAPLPSLVHAARLIFRDEPLPHIRRAHSAGIPATIDALVHVAKQARTKGERHLALVTGVPGAGKTLVGLQFVYEHQLGDHKDDRAAVFLSGNGPLVKVLQHALKSSVFVQDVHGFLRQYGGTTKRIPEEHIWVYDEAQRAWDAERVREKRGHGTSEPEDFLRLGERMPSWAMMVGLIGEGQEIHLGEEAGLRQWNEAIEAMEQPWVVHCPTKIAQVFSAAAQVNLNDSLDLTTSLRSHLAEDVQLWVRKLLDGQLEEAAQLAGRISAQGFDVYVTRSLEAAKNYVQERYHEQADKRYGLLASSKAKNLPQHGIRNDYSFTKNLREGPWYNDAPTSPRSCCQLQEVATEFACQGLELDFPIIAWGSDLTWRGHQWVSPPQPRSKALNPHQLRLNSYRVLLSRGRDGFVVFVPPEKGMDSSYDALLKAGLQVLA